MRFDIVTLFPEMVHGVASTGVLGRALEKGIISLCCWNPRDYTHDRHRTVDDRPYGGGPGMVMKVRPLRDAIQAVRAAAGKTKVIYLSPQGRRLDQEGVIALKDEAIKGNFGLTLVAGRYEGIDERFVELDVDEEWSIGDYVLSGGELAALVMVDAISRMVPGVLGDDESAAQDSFHNVLLDYPHYTRPEEIDGLKVPEVLLSGDHRAIEQWRMKQSLGRTWLRRPDLLGKCALDEEQLRLLEAFQKECRTTDEQEIN